jgi:hypothetical protein
MAGQPTPFFTGLSRGWIDDVWKGSVMLGARSAVALPPGATAGLLQASPNSMPFEAMELKERQMIALGAKLIEQKQVQRTATESNNDEASSSSVVSICAKNVSEAYEKVLSWVCAFAGVPYTEETVNFSLNSEMFATRLTAQEQQALIASWQAGALSFEEMRSVFKKAGLATEEDEDVKEAASQELQSGLGAGINAQQQDANADNSQDDTGSAN